MVPWQAARLGKYLREARNKKGLSAAALGELTDINDASIIRLENGKFAAPAPDKLARIAEALGLWVSDVFALAGYTVASELPSVMPYLRTKYSRLPEDAQVDLEQAIGDVLARHGVDLAELSDPAY